MADITYDAKFVSQQKREIHNLMIRYLEQARTALLNAMRVHEQADHSGEPCSNERVNSIAWLCHAVLLKPENIEQLKKLLEEYDNHHHDHEQKPEIQEAQNNDSTN